MALDEDDLPGLPRRLRAIDPSLPGLNRAVKTPYDVRRRSGVYHVPRQKRVGCIALVFLMFVGAAF